MQLDFFGKHKIKESKPKETKRCNQCATEKPLDEYVLMYGSYYGTTCKECTNKNARVVNQLKKEHPYPQDHVCIICNRTEEQLQQKFYKDKVFSLDHDHATMEFRGYICHTCNRGLGNFGDNIETLRNAIRYLEHNERSRLSKKADKDSPQD